MRDCDFGTANSRGIARNNRVPTLEQAGESPALLAASPCASVSVQQVGKHFNLTPRSLFIGFNEPSITDGYQSGPKGPAPPSSPSTNHSFKHNAETNSQNQ